MYVIDVDGATVAVRMSRDRSIAIVYDAPPGARPTEEENARATAGARALLGAAPTEAADLAAFRAWLAAVPADWYSDDDYRPCLVLGVPVNAALVERAIDEMASEEHVAALSLARAELPGVGAGDHRGPRDALVIVGESARPIRAAVAPIGAAMWPRWEGGTTAPKARFESAGGALADSLAPYAEHDPNGAREGVEQMRDALTIWLDTLDRRDAHALDGGA
jgi:hypothetical protein